MWLSLRSRNFSIHSSSSTIKISSSTINCQLCATRWKIMRIDFLQTFNKKHTYESKLMMMLWSIWFFVSSRTRLSCTQSRMKSLMICIKYSTIRIIVLTFWKLIVVWSKSNRLKISTSSELNLSDWRAILSCIIRRHFSKISRTKCLTSCKKLSLSSRIKSSICMSSLSRVDTLIRHWEMWIINSKISEKIFLIMRNVKKSSSSLIRIRITIDRFLVFDFKSLNSNSNRFLVQSLNHHQKIKWISSINIIMINRDISFAIVVNRERWIRITLYVKSRRTYRVKKILNQNRKKNNLCYSRCRDK
jgi:hypothetical protein